MNGNVIRTITIRGTSEGLDKLQTDLVKLTAAHKGVAIAAEETDKKTRSLEQSWKQQTLRLDEVARAQHNIARETKTAKQMLDEQRITTEQYGERLNLINQRYATATTATKALTMQTGLARHELVNLGRQAQDVGVSLMSGQSPFTVLVQQGAQIADVFATSGGTLRGFFGQAAGWAKGFFTSVGGITTAVLAIGAAAIYAASQFVRASTTIEEALENQNRLLKEGKALLDQRTTAEARAQLQSKEQTQFETMRNLLDLQIKLNTAMEDAGKLAASRATTPTGGGMPEMGAVPTGFAPLKDPGLDKITEAFRQLNAAREAGMPGLKDFNAELSKVGMEHPELAQIVEDMIKAGKAGMDLENATLRARAMSDALKGIATDAQMAAVGLGSLAQFKLTNLGAEEARAALERMAQHTLAIAAAYPGMSVEVAKQLDALQGQLTVAQARTGAEQMVTQEYVTQNTLLAQGKIAEEAIAIAAGQRAIAEANVTKSIADQIYSLEQQIELSKARLMNTEASVKAQHAYNDAIRQGADEADAAALADATLRQQQQQEHEQLVRTIESQDAALGNVGDEIQRNTGYQQNFNAELRDAIFWATSLAEAVEGTLDLLNTQFTDASGNRTQYTSTWDPLGLISRKEQYETQGTPYKMKTMGIGLGEFQFPAIDFDVIREKLSALVPAVEDLTASTDKLNATMTDVLSPYYSTDPRRTHLGFRAFAGGGIMTAHGELPLKHYQGGGVASSPQVAVYGEGSTPEAYVPVPSGRIPVEIRQPANSNRPVNVTINVLGNTDANTVSALKSTAFQQAHAMRRALG